jgi:hypothetical protein
MKQWFKDLGLKIKTGIVNLYGNSWFNGLSVLTLGVLIYMMPVIGAFVWVAWLTGWAFMAEK